MEGMGVLPHPTHPTPSQGWLCSLGACSLGRDTLGNLGTVRTWGRGRVGFLQMCSACCWQLPLLSWARSGMWAKAQSLVGTGWQLLPVALGRLWLYPGAGVSVLARSCWLRVCLSREVSPDHKGVNLSQLLSQVAWLLGVTLGMGRTVD